MNDKMTIVQIPLDMLEPHPDNPRKDLGDLTELADSIKANGIMQNLTVVASPDPNKYRVVIGHRRMAAANLAGLTELPCVVSDMDHKEQVATMLAENMQRSDLTVYEQAWGFQQMTLLGCSVDEISSKSGFSQSTVRRRLKMAELDQKTLKDVSERQLSLADFDRLAEIEDIAARNDVLKSIGTQDFGQALANAKVKQAVAKHLPALKKWLKEHGVKKITQKESWTSKYKSFTGKSGEYYHTIYVDRLGESGNTLPTDKEIDGKELFYCLNDRFLYFYEIAPKAPRESKSREQLDRERLAREVKKEIKALSDLHYGLRNAFIEQLKVTKANKEAVLIGAALIGLYYSHGRSVNHSDDVSKSIGLDNYEYSSTKIVQGIGKLTDGYHNAELARAIYAMYRDNPENWFASGMEMTGSVPYFSERNSNTSLELLYNWLMLLGYEMSTDETAMMDGTHELYHKEKKK